MISVSEIKTSAPETFRTELQEKAYDALGKLGIKYERVDTDVVITMEDCEEVNKKLDMDMVKTLFLTNTKKGQYYLFITKGRKHFNTRAFCNGLGVSRVSFAPKELFEEMLGTEIGAATVYSALIDPEKKILIVFDKDVADSEWYGCSDGTTTGYMKVKTQDILKKFMPYTKHDYRIIIA